MGIDNRTVYARRDRRSPSRRSPWPACSTGSQTQFAPAYGPLLLIFAFEAVVIGGLGSLWGTLVGGVMLGVAQTIGAEIEPDAGSSPVTWCSSPSSWSARTVCSGGTRRERCRAHPR